MSTFEPLIVQSNAILKGSLRRFVRSMIIRSGISLICASAFMFATYVPQSRAEEHFQFDAEKCVTGLKGEIYISLGNRVFHFPWAHDVPHFIASLPPKMQRTPPDASEVVGCEHNPVQLTSFSSNNHFLWKTTDDDPDVLVGIYWLFSHLPTKTPEDSVWGGENLGRDARRRTCTKATVTDVLSNGLEACRVEPFNPPHPPMEDWATSYSSDPDHYATPLGRRLIADCGPGIYTTTIGNCSVAYAITSDLGVLYNFHPFHGLHPLSLDKLISFDRSLRQHLNAAELRDYNWPDALINHWGDEK